jgi:O-methyltransferase
MPPPLAYRLPISPGRQARLDRALDELPRPGELSDLRTFRAGRDLRGRLWDEGYTMLSSRRGRALYRLARHVVDDEIDGALVDCGVWNGGSSIILGVAAPKRRVWAFDSFEGLPEPGPEDGARSAGLAGDCRGAEEKLRAGFEAMADPARLEVRKGWFEDTLRPAAEEVGPVALLHCDGDWYESVRLTLDVFLPLVVPGGFVLIDDYGTWPGARRATDEARAAAGERAPLKRVDHTGRYWRKAA